MTADELIRLLDELQQRLAGPAKYVFDLAVRDVFISGLGWLGFAVVLTIIAAFALRIVRRSGVTFNDPVDLVMSMLFGSLIGGGFSFVWFVAWSNALSYLLNPEWHALQRIILTLKP